VLLLSRSGAGNGQTLGKRWLGLRVLSTSGGPVSRQMRGGVRGLVIVLLGVVTGGLFLLVDFLWPLGESSHRALHDLWSGVRGERALNRARPVSGTLSVVDEFRRGWRSLSAPVLQPLMSAHAAARST
jgi:hypothetical protein